VTDVYDRRCAITGERTLPVLEAAHIKAYSSGGPHEPENGLLLRSDVHTLFDKGYVTVDADQLKVVVSSRIREEFENGRDYYHLHGRAIRLPRESNSLPSHDIWLSTTACSVSGSCLSLSQVPPFCRRRPPVFIQVQGLIICFGADARHCRSRELERLRRCSLTRHRGRTLFTTLFQYVLRDFETNSLCSYP